MSANHVTSGFVECKEKIACLINFLNLFSISRFTCLGDNVTVVPRGRRAPEDVCKSSSTFPPLKPLPVKRFAAIDDNGNGSPALRRLTFAPCPRSPAAGIFARDNRQDAPETTEHP